MKAVLRPWIARLSALLRGLGPYAAIELLLPGGSLIAMFLWLYRHRVSVGMHVRQYLSFFAREVATKPEAHLGAAHEPTAACR